MQQQLKNNAIADLQENITRLQKTIDTGFFQAGYIRNCKIQIESYKKQLLALQHSH